jgi:hypothetical protein
MEEGELHGVKICEIYICCCECFAVMTGVLFKNECGTDYVGFNVRAETVGSVRDWYGIDTDNTVWMKCESVSETNRIVFRCINNSDFMYDGEKLSSFFPYLTEGLTIVESIGKDYIVLCVPSCDTGSTYNKGMKFIKQL